MPRQGDPETIEENVPEEFRPLVGDYNFAQANTNFQVKYYDGCLAIYNPLEKHTVRLEAPDEHGWRLDEFGKHSILFETDDSGQVTALKLDSTSRAKRK
jgi:hypothetical protein